MANLYDTQYKYNANETNTTTKLNERLQSIDTRLDALEDHVADNTNPHLVTASQLSAAVSAHTHNSPNPMAWVKEDAISAETLSGEPQVVTAGTIVGVRAVLRTAGTTATTIDIQKSGDNGATFTSIFSTKPTIDANEKSTVTAATPAVLSTTTFSANDIFRCIVDSAGTNAADLTVTLWHTHSLAVA